MDKKYIFKGNAYNREELEKIAFSQTLKAAKNVFNILGEVATEMYDESEVRVVIGSPDSYTDEVMTTTGTRDFVTKNFRVLSFKNTIAISGNGVNSIASEGEFLVSISLLDGILNGLTHRIYNETSGVILDVNYIRSYKKKFY